MYSTVAHTELELLLFLTHFSVGICYKLFYMYLYRNESYVRLAFLLILGIFMMYMWKSIS